MDIQKVVDNNDNVQLLKIAQELIRHVIASVDIINEDDNCTRIIQTLDFGNNKTLDRLDYDTLMEFIRIR